MTLKGKVGIVTGAGRGLGREIALTLAREGMDMVVADMAMDQTEAIISQIQGAGSRALAVETDVTSAAAVEEMVTKTMEAFGRIDVLINNAGVVLAVPLTKLEESAWDKVMDVNLKGVFLCCKAVAPHMIRQSGGKIINIASVAGKKGHPLLAAYCSSKYGVIGLTMALSQELGPHNINVNAICPGFIRTAMWEDVLAPAFAPVFGVEKGQMFDAFIQASVPLKRPQTEGDIAQCVVYLCKAENVSGTTITVDGGHTMS